MQYYFTADEIRRAEAPLIASLPDGAVMRRAAHGLAAVVADELRHRTGGVVGRRVQLLVGSGDNGGDALWAGAMLRRRGVAVVAILLAPDRAHPAGLSAFLRSGGRVSESGSSGEVGTSGADLVVDGIVGISGRGPLRPDAARAVAAITAPIVAVDLPSGVDCDTGAATGPAVNAAVTAVMGAFKPVHALAADRCGRIALIPIGLPVRTSAIASLSDAEVGRSWPVPGPRDDKYSQGVVGIVAGSAQFPGAAVLCTGGAVAATSGMVRYVGTGREDVLNVHPEVVATADLADAGRVQAWVFGPGAGTDSDASARLEHVLSQNVPVLVDADGLTLVAKNPDLVIGRTAPTLLTPHAGEFHRLTGVDPSADRIGATRELAATWGVTVLLKGHATVIAEPDGAVLVNDARSSWASTAGSGDVLAGITGALLANGFTPRLAAAVAARAHSVAAQIAADGAPTSAGPLMEALRPAIRQLRDVRGSDQ